MTQARAFGLPTGVEERAAEHYLPAVRQALIDLFGPARQRGFSVRLWNGEVEEPPGATPFTLVFRHPGTVRRMFLPPSELAIGEAYIRDDFDIEGDIEAAMRLGDHLAGQVQSPRTLYRLFRALAALPARDTAGEVARDRAMRLVDRELHSRERDLAAVRFHYDVGNDFYRLWLDQRLVYSCAYFKTGSETLDEAQEAKLDLICRKLRLQPGERLLDIGCGWGGLIIHAARHYGVEALGVTLSRAQAEIARQRIDEAGLRDRCRVEIMDYRDVSPDVPFDKIVSVGMFEHVGHQQFPTYFSTAYRLLKPSGIFLNHTISLAPASSIHLRLAQRLTTRWIWYEGQFITRYVFPDSELVRPAQAIEAAEQAGFETRDVENLREHYALTLRHWVRRLEARHDEAVALVGEPTYRVWRLYMAASAYGFAAGKTSVIQTLLAKPEAGRTVLPLTREDIYAKG